MTEIVQFSRRSFLKLSGASMAAAGLAGAGVSTALADGVTPGTMTYDKIVPTLCEQCVWRCGVYAKIKNGKVVHSPFIYFFQCI